MNRNRQTNNAPDRPSQPGEWGYRPEHASTVSVNPPSLTWVHLREATGYDVQWSSRRDFTDATTVQSHRWCVYTHCEPLKPGRYYWRYRARLRDGGFTGWSQTREFVVPAKAISQRSPS